MVTAALLVCFVSIMFGASLATAADTLILHDGIDRYSLGRYVEFLEDRSGTLTFENIVGESPAIMKLCDTIRTVAHSDAPVLILGETGTGKELVANALCALSSRSDKPFIKINCAAVPETLFESELFGYEKGAFTGAQARRKGKLEAAQGGTVPLDEIGDMPFLIQAKLLRVIEERTIST